jgi:MauM/NapG family ferredoxin protein
LSEPANDETDERPLARRRFFSEGFRHILRPLAEILEKRLEPLNAMDWRDTEPPPAVVGAYRDGEARGKDGDPGYGGSPPYPAPGGAGRILLRPPGALPEAEFLQRCTASGRCVAACPVAAIKPDWSDDPLRNRKPIIEARLQACVVCDDLSCMKVCPSGALRDLPREEIRMGTAVLRPDLCVRSQGEECQICVDKCPVGRTAIEIPYHGAEVVVKADGCVGCGVCEMYCPTQPKAIVVEPPAASAPPTR